jgi:hypothetical protein
LRWTDSVCCRAQGRFFSLNWEHFAKLAPLENKVDASRRAEKCRSLRVKVEAGVLGCALRPILPSAPYSLPPQPPVRPIVTSSTRFRPSLASAPASLPPRPRFRPRLPSALGSLPPQPRFRPMLPSAPGSLPPHAPFSPSLPSASGRPWMLIGRSRVRRRGASKLFGIDV